MTHGDARMPDASDDEGTRLYVVDRREGSIVVLIDDEDRSAEVDAGSLPRSCRSEGAVLRVPLGPNGVPLWGAAVRDRKEERRRLAEMAARVRRLRRSDPGGDIVL